MRLRSDIYIMKYMGWSWDQYLEAPHEIVEEIIYLINKEAEKDE